MSHGNYLDCGCYIDESGTRHWCPSCTSGSVEAKVEVPTVTSTDLQDAFLEGFCYAEDVGHTTGDRLAKEAARRYPAARPVESKAEAGEPFAWWIKSDPMPAKYGYNFITRDKEFPEGTKVVPLYLRPAPADALRAIRDRHQEWLRRAFDAGYDAAVRGVPNDVEIEEVTKVRIEAAEFIDAALREGAKEGT